MNAPISYGISRNMPATDKNGRPCSVALVLVQFPDLTVQRLVIPEALLATIPPDKRDDFIQAEVESVVGYKVTLAH